MVDSEAAARARRRAEVAGDTGPDEPARERSPGTRDPERTSAAILAAAVAEFTEKGFGGARVDAIAERAGINKRMLYHYFGDKDALYARALREIYDGIRSAERGLGLEALEPEAGIRRLATFTWRYFLAHPEFLGLLATENMNRAATLRAEPWSGRVNSSIVDGLADLLRRGVAQGLFRRGVDPAELYVTMIGIGYFALSNRHTLAVSFGRDFAEGDLGQRWGEHMADVTLAWLRAGAGSGVAEVQDKGTANAGPKRRSAPKAGSTRTP